ncbi:hypothetical protein RUM43_008315 [Polyplax serrata]|uniref:Uncharacterized protein n=1 Tax=Polyplax serrata TaxID=468196 RepID=A0AAN8S2D3_POLSC
MREKKSPRNVKNSAFCYSLKETKMQFVSLSRSKKRRGVKEQENGAEQQINKTKRNKRKLIKICSEKICEEKALSGGSKQKDL